MFKIKYIENINKKELKLNKQFNSCIKNDVQQTSLKSSNKKIQNSPNSTKTNLLASNSTNYPINSQETKENLKFQDKIVEKNNRNERVSIVLLPKNNNNKNLIRSKSCVSPLLPKTFLKEYQQKSIEGKINKFLEELQKQLLKSNIIEQRPLCATIKKAKFLQIFGAFAQYLIQIDSSSESFSKKQFCCLKPIFQKLSDMIDDSKNKKKRQSLNLKSYVFGKEYSKVHFQQDTSLYTMKINDFSQKMINLQTKLEQYRSKIQILQKTYLERKFQYMGLCQQYNVICQKINRQKERLQLIEQQVSQKSIYLSKINQQVDKIANFAEAQQQKKILKWVGQTYKKCQFQMSEYAKFLQNGNFLQQINFDSQSSKEDQEWLEQQVVKVLSKPQKHSVILQKITLLISIFIDKIKSNEKEIIKTINFKNTCFIRFTDLIKNWIQTFEMKKQYISGLRMQFATLADFINKIIANIEVLKKNEPINSNFSVLVQSLKKHWNKMQLNYKYCSSFF